MNGEDMTLECAVASVGAGHDPSEAAFGLAHAGHLAVVAESVGMRSRACGGAHTSVQAVLSAVPELPKTVAEATSALQAALLAAHRAEWSEWPGKGLAGSPTAVAIVATIFLGSTVVVAHAGNARCYRTRAGTLSLLTRDHSVLAELRTGLEDPLDEPSDPFQVHHRNLLTRGLGMNRDLQPDVATRSVRPGDRFLLCSASLWTALPATTLPSALGAPSPDAVCRELCAQVRAPAVGYAMVVAELRGQLPPNATKYA